jgi:hypothetical protein
LRAIAVVRHNPEDVKKLGGVVALTKRSPAVWRKADIRIIVARVKELAESVPAKPQSSSAAKATSLLVGPKTSNAKRLEAFARETVSAKVSLLYTEHPVFISSSYSPR